MTSTPPAPQPDDPQNTGTVPLNKPSGSGSGGPLPPSGQPGPAQPFPGQPGNVPPPGAQAWPGPPPGQPGYGAPGQPGYGAPGYRAVSPSDERLWATLSHVAGPAGALISYGTVGWAVPLIVFLVYKDRSRFIREQAAEALNFQITLLLAYLIVLVITIVTFGIGAFLFLVPLVLSIIFGIIAAVTTNRGEGYRYPFNIRLVS